MKSSGVRVMRGESSQPPSRVSPIHRPKAVRPMTMGIGRMLPAKCSRFSPLSPVAVPLRVRTPECVLISARRRCPARALLPWTAITTWMCALPLTISPVPVISAGMA